MTREIKKVAKKAKAIVKKTMSRNDVIKAVAKARGAEKRPDLSKKDLSGADLSNLVVKSADFKGSCLIKTNFDGCNLQGCDFTGCDMEDATFIGADLRFSIKD